MDMYRLIFETFDWILRTFLFQGNILHSIILRIIEEDSREK
jgi:hypothetical protein